MEKTNIRIVVQGKSENSEDFAKRLEKFILLEVRKVSEKALVVGRPTLLMTSSDTGRQTATFQFMTKEENSI